MRQKGKITERKDVEQRRGREGDDIRTDEQEHRQTCLLIYSWAWDPIYKA